MLTGAGCVATLLHEMRKHVSLPNETCQRRMICPMVKLLDFDFSSIPAAFNSIMANLKDASSQRSQSSQQLSACTR
ncbi:hypothetical protein ACSQ67_015653 [Phaseolus vulgaris]